jgi:hypothetical protein
MHRATAFNVIQFPKLAKTFYGYKTRRMEIFGQGLRRERLSFSAFRVVSFPINLDIPPCVSLARHHFRNQLGAVVVDVGFPDDGS